MMFTLLPLFMAFTFMAGSSDCHFNKEKCDQELQAIKAKIDLSAEAVGFQASLTTSVDIKANGSLVLDRVEYNSGGGYDPKTGMFTVPATGLYLFLLNMAADNGNSAWITVVVDNTDLCKTWSRFSTEIETSSCQATARAVKGQRVWLRNTFNSRVRGLLWTTFGGVLIQREY